MNPQQLLLDLNLDPTVAIGLAAGVLALVAFILFLIGRLAWDARQVKRAQQARLVEEQEPAGFALELPVPNEAKGAALRFDENLELMAEATGLGISGAAWIGLMLLGGLGLAGGLYLWRSELNIAVGGFVFGVAAPLAVLLIARQRVKAQMQQQLPDAIYFLARSLRAGLSFEQAMTLVAGESPQPLGKELRRVAEHLRLGLAPPAAMQIAARRLQLPDFHLLLSVIGLHTQTGGNLALLLDRLAAATRDRNQYLGYFRSATALGRTSAIAIGAAVPVLFLGYLFFEPTYAQRFFESGTGLALLGTAFGLELLGAVWLWWLLKVEY